MVTTSRSFQECFHIEVWCGVIDNALVGPYLFANTQNEIEYHQFLCDDLPQFLEDVLLQIRKEKKDLWYT